MATKVPQAEQKSRVAKAEVRNLVEKIKKMKMKKTCNVDLESRPVSRWTWARGSAAKGMLKEPDWILQVEQWHRNTWEWPQLLEARPLQATVAISGGSRMTCDSRIYWRVVHEGQQLYLLESCA